MAKWLTALVLAAVLGGNALAGFSMHPPDEGCGMPGCCDAARSQENTPESIAAQACCKLNCPQPAPTGQGVSVSPLLAVSLHAPALRPPTLVPASVLCHDRAGPPAQPSRPTYIRHLALLI